MAKAGTCPRTLCRCSTTSRGNDDRSRSSKTFAQIQWDIHQFRFGPTRPLPGINLESIVDCCTAVLCASRAQNLGSAGLPSNRERSFEQGLLRAELIPF